MGNYLALQTRHHQPRRFETARARLHQITERLRLEQSPTRLAYHSPLYARETPLSLQAVITLSEQALDMASRRTLQSLSVFPAKPNSFSEAAALAVSAEPGEMLDTLHDAGLLESIGPERYMLHQTIADYASLRSSDDRAQRRFAAYFTDYLEAHSTDYEVLGQEVSNLDAALQAAFACSMPDALVRGANAFTSFLKMRGLYPLAQAHLTRAEEAARERGDVKSLAKVLSHLGQLADKQGDGKLAEAYYQEGLVAAHQVNYRERICALLRGLGAIADRQGHYDQAEAYYLEGISLARRIPHLESIGALLHNLGALAEHQGNYPQAQIYLQEALTLARQMDHREQISGMLLNLAVVIALQGDYQQAKTYLQESLVLARQMRRSESISIVLMNLSEIALLEGDAPRAEEELQEALVLARQIEHKEYMCATLQSLGKLALKGEIFPQAQSYLQGGLALARELEHPVLTCLCLSLQGDLWLKEQQWDRAAATFHDLRATVPEGNREYTAEARYGLARVAWNQGHVEDALQHGEASLTLFKEIGHSKAAEVKQWMISLSQATAQQREADGEE